jgi:hypothetical protein
MEFLDLPMDIQIKIAKLEEGMTRDEYIAHLDYLANETMEQFDERLKNAPANDFWTEERKKHFINKMSVNPQKID